MTTEPGTYEPQYCSDSIFVAAPPEEVFDIMLDVAGWNIWWTMVGFSSADARLRPGSRIVFDGGVSKWTGEVGAVDRPRRIELRYVEGALLGLAAWEITPEPGGCRAAYVYHGVRANQERAATTFGRHGTRLHTMVMQADALPGLVRRVAGEPLDDAWRVKVRTDVAAGREALAAAA